jgi:GNAT superfamily N-acetyltransferase
LKQTELYFREGNENDAPKIIELFRLVFGKTRNLEEWRWRFVDGPVRQLLIVLALDRSENIVAHYALHPVWMTYRGRKVLGAQSLDTMVLPSFRGNGLFKETARRCYHLAQRNGIELLYGFPNEQSYPVFVKRLGWTETAKLLPLYYILNPQNVIRSRLSHQAGNFLLKQLLTAWLGYDKKGKVSSSKGSSCIKVCRTSDFDQTFDALWSECKSQFIAGVWKDSKYLRWRYLDVPHGEHQVIQAFQGDKMVGFMVIGCIRENGLHVGIITDLLVCGAGNAAINALIKTALSIFKASRMDMAKVFLLKGSSYYKLFRSEGFSNFWRQGSQTIVKTLGDIADGERSFAHGEWHLTIGDMDSL